MEMINNNSFLTRLEEKKNVNTWVPVLNISLSPVVNLVTKILIIKKDLFFSLSLSLRYVCQIDVPNLQNNRRDFLSVDHVLEGNSCFSSSSDILFPRRQAKKSLP